MQSFGQMFEACTSPKDKPGAQTAGRGGLLRPDRVGGIPAAVYGASRPYVCFVFGHVAVARGSPQATSPACDSPVGGRHRFIPKIRVPWWDTRDEIHSHLVENANQARAQSEIPACRVDVYKASSFMRSESSFDIEQLEAKKESGSGLPGPSTRSQNVLPMVIRTMDVRVQPQL